MQLWLPMRYTPAMCAYIALIILTGLAINATLPSSLLSSQQVK